MAGLIIADARRDPLCIFEHTARIHRTKGRRWDEMSAAAGAKTIMSGGFILEFISAFARRSRQPKRNPARVLGALTSDRSEKC
jgi:hypothetical protein